MTFLQPNMFLVSDLWIFESDISFTKICKPHARHGRRRRCSTTSLSHSEKIAAVYWFSQCLVEEIPLPWGLLGPLRMQKCEKFFFPKVRSDFAHQINVDTCRLRQGTPQDAGISWLIGASQGRCQHVGGGTTVRVNSTGCFRSIEFWQLQL